MSGLQPIEQCFGEVDNLATAGAAVVVACAKLEWETKVFYAASEGVKGIPPS